jgi:hypothetical protein
MEQVSNKRLSFILSAAWLAIVILSLAACEPADVRDIENTLSESATLAAVMSEGQPVQSVRATSPATGPTKKPTRAATKGASPRLLGKRIKNTPGDLTSMCWRYHGRPITVRAATSTIHSSAAWEELGLCCMACGAVHSRLSQ